ncbi:MAG: hypothetical protein U0T82_07915 [Bacteroidales bacterium]
MRGRLKKSGSLPVRSGAKAGGRDSSSGSGSGSGRMPVAEVEH